MINRRKVYNVVFIILFLVMLIYSAALTVHYQVPAKLIAIISRHKVITVLRDEKTYLNNISYREITSFYDYYNNSKTRIVMIGDSITYRVSWNELLGRDDIINRGIGSDTTSGVIARLEEIISRKPEIAFIMIGINDLAKSIPIEEIYSNYIDIIEKLRKNKIAVIIQSTLLTRDNKNNINAKVIDLNALLNNYCIQQKMQYIDLNKLLSDGNRLNEEYTIDGVHLLGNAYGIWKNEINKYL